MSSTCPTPSPDAPLVQSLIGSTDCHIHELVHASYGALFPSGGGGFAPALTMLLTLYVGLTGYRLILGRGGLNVGETTISLIKIGGILALSTQWETYQSVVFGFLFDGPNAMATTMLQAAGGSGDVFGLLQETFDALTKAAMRYTQVAPSQVSPLLGGTGLAAMALNGAAGLLLLCSAGEVVAAKIVLGLLLATGPLFLTMLLFDSTRGIFEGWVRAALSLAFMPLALTFLLAIMLILMNGSIAQLQELLSKNDLSLAPVYSIVTLVCVYAIGTLGAIAACVMIFSGFRLPTAPRRTVSSAAAPSQAGATFQAIRAVETTAPGSRHTARSATSAVLIPASMGSGALAAGARGEPAAAVPRLGETARRAAGPRTLSSRDRSSL